MRPVKFTTGKIVRHIQSLKVVKIKDLLIDLACSTCTLFNKLSNLYHTSYNFNRQYLTLRDIPEFDSNGIWRYKGIMFSKWTTIEETIHHVVEMSSAGLSASDVSNILQVKTHNQLSKCRKKGILISKRYGRNKIYFSSNESIAKSQIKNRQKMMQKRSKEIKTHELAEFKIDKLHFGYLAQLILEEALIADDIYAMLKGMGKSIERKEIKEILINYKIAKKKLSILLVPRRKNARSVARDF